MLNIYRDKIPKNSILWDDPELAFQGMLQMGHTFDDKLCREVMKNIDGVTVKNGQFIKTKFGDTHISKLQTGCKTVLIALELAKDNKNNKIIQIVECGSNAINLLARIQIEYSIETKVYTDQYIQIPDKQFKCRLDGVEYSNGQKLYFKMRGWLD